MKCARLQASGVIKVQNADVCTKRPGLKPDLAGWFALIWSRSVGGREWVGLGGCNKVTSEQHVSE